MSHDNVVEIQDFIKLEHLVKTRLGCDHILLGGVTRDGDVITFYSTDIPDINLSYLIQTLVDRRQASLEDV